MAIVFVLIGFASIGSVLPLWTFLNSLQIITHSTLLNTMMPSSVHYFFKDYLDLIRLNWTWLNEALTDRASYHLKQESSNSNDGYYNIYLEASDYVLLFGQNMVVFCYVGLFILSIWLGLALKDRFRHKLPSAWRRRLSKGKLEPQANNFALRFFYEFFFEICICAYINLAHVDFSSFSNGMQWIMSLAFGTTILVYVGWLLSLFCKNGPFLEGFY